MNKLLNLGILSLFMLLFLYRGNSQGYYPLEIGNIWEYHDIFEPEYGFTTRATKDTIMQNGIEYTLLKNEGEKNDPFYFRQFESKVYQYKFEADYLIFDFSKTVGDTVSIYISNGDTILTTVLYEGVHNIFGENHKSWVFYQQFLPTTFFLMWGITDSIGISTLEAEVSPKYTLRGALINGTVYGTLSTMEPPSIFYPQKYQLLQNYPNPFNPMTTLYYNLPEESFVNLRIYDIIGREVRTLINGIEKGGTRKIVWDSTDESGTLVSSGIYFYRMSARPIDGGESFSRVRRMVLMR